MKGIVTKKEVYLLERILGMFKEFLFYFCVISVCFVIGLGLAMLEIIPMNFVIYGLLGIGLYAFYSDIYPFIESKQRKRK